MSGLFLADLPMGEGGTTNAAPAFLRLDMRCTHNQPATHSIIPEFLGL